MWRFPTMGSGVYLLVFCCIWASASFRVMRWHWCGRKGQGKKRLLGIKSKKSERAETGKKNDGKRWGLQSPIKRLLSSHNRPYNLGQTQAAWKLHSSNASPFTFQGLLALPGIKCCLSRVTLWPHGCWQAVNKVVILREEFKQSLITFHCEF